MSIPPGTIFESAAIGNIRIAGSGRLFACVCGTGGAFWVKIYNELIEEQSRIGPFSSAPHSLDWLSSERELLISVDAVGDERPRFFVFNLLAQELRPMFPNVPAKARFIQARPDGSILVSALLRGPGSGKQLYKVNVSASESEPLLDATRNVFDFHVPRHQDWLVVLASSERGLLELRLGNLASMKCRIEFTVEFSAKTSEVSICGMRDDPADGPIVYVLSDLGRNTTALASVNMKTGKMDILAADQDFDIGRAYMDPRNSRPIAVMIEGTRPKWRPMSPDGANLIGDLDARLTNYYILGSDDGGRLWTIQSISDTSPAEYGMFDATAKTWRPLPSSRPKLKGQRFCETRHIELVARDKMLLRGYITVPSSPRDPPLMVRVHGGPWDRDLWAWEPERQWLASCGLAVLQINFRGSTGYGKNLRDAGNKEWGRSIQSDLMDSVSWARSNWQFSSKTAIMGSSFGGYAALLAVSKFPEHYCCAISIAGPPDLLRFCEELPNELLAYRQFFNDRIGNPHDDRALLIEQSPLSNIGEIGAPIMIVQGVHDSRVSVNSTRQYVRALQAASKEVEYLEFDDEGHDIRKLSNKIIMYCRIQTFIERFVTKPNASRALSL